MANFTAKEIRTDKYYKPQPKDMEFRHEAWCNICGEPFDLTKYTSDKAREIMENHSENLHKNSALSLPTIDNIKALDWKGDPRQRAYHIRKIGD